MSCRRSYLALLGLSLLAVSPSSGQLPPEKMERSFTVSSGLEFKLWASEPLFVNPTCMDVDPLGRVWVCESVNYRNRLRGQKKLTRPEGDRIVILEDTTGKGLADKATTFYQHPDLMAPLGIAVARNPVGPGWKVYVCQSPDIFVLEDTDGDGKADGPPKKLLTGFRGIDHDHGVHGILIGPDRKLYFSVGDAGVGGLQSSDGKGRKWTSNSTDCRAGTIWRCDLDGKNLELIAHNFRNEYEPCVDSFGTVFVSDNDDDGNQQTRICHVFPGGNYGYHPRGRGETHWHEEQPGVVPKILRTYFGSPTGMCFHEGSLLPKKYHGQPLHTDAGPRHLRCYHLTAQGATFAVDREDVVQSTDTWFRPSDVCVAPDGSVFVADWYDPGVGGHAMGDRKFGRIYRLTPAGHKGYRVPKVDLESSKGLLAALASPALSVRYQAMAKLDGMKKADALALLEPAAGKKDDPILRARTLWQMARLGGEAKVFEGLFDDPDPRFQILGLRIARDFLGHKDSALVADVLKLARKADSSVLRECLLALRDQDPVKVKDALYTLMKSYDGKDRHFLAAIGISVGHLDEKRRETLLADFDRHFGTWNDQAAGLVWELRPPRVLPLLGKRLHDVNIPAAQRARVVDIVATSNDPRAGHAVLELLSSDTPAAVRERVIFHLKQFLPARWGKLQKSPELDRALDFLLARPQFRDTAVALIAAAGRTDQVDKVLDLARNKDESQSVRRAAIAALGELPSAGSITGLIDLLEKVPGDLQGDVAGALGEIARRSPKEAETRKARQKLESLVIEPKTTPGLRESAVGALAASRLGSQWLLKTYQAGKLPESVIATTGRLLRNSPYRDTQDTAIKTFPIPGKMDLKKLPSLAVLAARKGDPEKGKKLLAASVKSNLQCLKCHTIRGVGGFVGPDLSMIGKKGSRENLFESILYPSKAIADQYLTWVIETNKGLSLQGLLVEETPAGVVLRDAEGRDHRIGKKEIESRNKSVKSLMPEDVVLQLSEDELVDVVEYLFSLKTPAVAVDSWRIVGPFDNGSGMEGLDRVFGPEKAIDLEATYDGKDGKVRWTTVKPGAGGYVDLQAFYAGRSNEIVSYLTREIASPVEQEATILLGSDDGAKVWVNDKMVLTSRQTRAAAPEQDRVKVSLKKGNNRILLKVNNGNGGHGIYFTLLTEQEVKLAGK